jgi:hypothetical protein
VARRDAEKLFGHASKDWRICLATVRMERRETRKTNEVRNIQRKNVADPVYVHRGSQSCVTHLDA